MMENDQHNILTIINKCQFRKFLMKFHEVPRLNSVRFYKYILIYKRLSTTTLYWILPVDYRITPSSRSISGQ